MCGQLVPLFGSTFEPKGFLEKGFVFAIAVAINFMCTIYHYNLHR